MGINVSSLSPTQAREYWLDYNNGNKKGISDAEYSSICTKFRSYVSSWENDETTYNYTASPSERLDFDEDDAGFFSSDGKGVDSTLKTTVVGAGAIFSKQLSNFAQKKLLKESTRKAAQEATEQMTEKIAEGATQKAAKEGLSQGAKKAVDKVNNVDAGILLVVAALQLASAIHTKANSPNKEAVEACQTAKEELYVEQATLADQILTMEEMQEEMTILQAEAEMQNENGQEEIVTMESLYNYYYTRYKNGTATDDEIDIMNALGAQMQTTQATTTETTQGLNAEIAEVGEGYEEVSTNIQASNDFTNYVSEFDEATKVNSIIQGGLMTLSCAGAASTAYKCAIRAKALGTNPFTSLAAALYVAAAASAGIASGLFAAEAVKQFTTNRKIAEETISTRKDTQDLSVETTEFQEVSTEFWEETVDETSIDNLFTLTPTYANQTVTAQNQNTNDKTTRNAQQNTTNTTTTRFGNVTGGSSDNDKEKDKEVK